MKAGKANKKNGSKKYDRRGPVAVMVLVFLLFITGTAFGVAWMWQNVQESASALGMPEKKEMESSAFYDSVPEMGRADTEHTSVSTPDVRLTAPVSEISEQELPDMRLEEEDAPEEENPIETRAARSEFYYAVPESPRVPLSYFDDAIFFGDSISVGIPTYNVIPNAKVVAFTGINTTNAATRECIETDSGHRVTMLEAAKEFGDKKKVYIMLGGNGLGYDEEQFIGGYREFLIEIKLQYPDAIIYLQTMTPVTDKAKETYADVSNETIYEYNLAIQELAKSENVYFLDVASVMIDDNGKLPEEASPLDGMHFTPEYYAKWFAYLRTHTVLVKD